MPSEVAIIAIVKPAAGKLERVRELFRDTISWIEANEPGTLEFSVCEDMGENGPHFSLFERYESEVAMKLHEGSENYKAMFKTITEEQLFEGAPVITRGILTQGFKR